jgi:two-component system, LytTR family, response regulator
MMPATYRSVVVENEEHSRTRLRRLLTDFNREVEIVGEAADGPSAVAIVRSSKPELLFLDIDLPGFNGFQVLEQLDYQPAVIFTTAFNEHALRAFDTFAIDYLLKPIDAEALERALGKLRAMGFNHTQFSRALEQLVETSQSRYLSRVSCRVGDRTVLVKIGEVLYFQADHKYTSVQVASGEYLIDVPLVELEQRLNPRDFVRIHRSTLVNVAWISEIRRAYDGRLRVVLCDAKNTELVASRSYADNLRSL